MTVLAVIFLFSVIILVHELGHYLAACRAGVQVLSFNIGFGPVLFAKNIRGTFYALRLFPIGGAVQLAGLDEGDKVKIPRSKNYQRKSLWQRFLIIFSGSAMNVLLAFCLFAFIYSFIGIPQKITNRLDSVLSGSPAAKAGLQRGDTLLKVNNYSIGDVEQAVRLIHATPSGRTLTVVYARQNKNFTREVPVTYNAELKASVIGIQLAPGDYRRVNVFKALQLGAVETYFFARMFLSGLASMFSAAFFQNVYGPVGIISLSSEAASRGLSIYLGFMAMLSLNIGFLNILPLPALDGGRLVFILYELITRRKPNQVFERYVHLLGFIFLMLLVILVSYQDIKKLINF